MQLQITPPLFDRPGFRWNLDVDGDGDLVVSIEHRAGPVWLCGWGRCLAGTCMATDADGEAVQAAAMAAIADLHGEWRAEVGQQDMSRAARRLSRENTELCFAPERGGVETRYRSRTDRVRRCGLAAASALLGGTCGLLSGIQAAAGRLDGGASRAAFVVEAAAARLAVRRDPAR